MIEKKEFKPIEATAPLEQADWEALVQQVQQLPSESEHKRNQLVQTIFEQLTQPVGSQVVELSIIEDLVSNYTKERIQKSFEIQEDIRVLNIQLTLAKQEQEVELIQSFKDSIQQKEERLKELLHEVRGARAILEQIQHSIS